MLIVILSHTRFQFKLKRPIAKMGSNQSIQTATSRAISLDNAEAVELMLSVSSSKRAITNYMSQAVSEGSLDVVKTLINHQANVNQLNPVGESLLHSAAFRGHTDIAKVLIENSADVNIASKVGVTALMCSASKGNIGVTRLLLSARAHVDSISAKSNTSLRLAAVGNYPIIMQDLIEAGADVDTMSSDGHSALGASAYFGNVEAVKTLLAAKADITLGARGDTPLHLAARGLTNQHQITVLLLEAGSEWFRRNDKGRMPINVARSPSVTCVLEQANPAYFLHKYSAEILKAASEEEKEPLARLGVVEKDSE